MDDYSEFVTAFGKRIKETRKEAGMSQRTFSKHIDVTDRALVNYEHGWRCMNVWTLFNVCKSLGISADRLLGLDGE